MSIFQTVLTVIGGATLWFVTGFLQAKLVIKYDSDYDHENFIVPATLFWPFFTVVMPLYLFGHDGIPWIKRKWKNFRAPKVAVKEEKLIEKIRMCPALKLKKYEQLLTEIDKDHEMYYRGGTIERACTQFRRIKDGKPEIKKMQVELRNFGAVAAHGAFANAEIVRLGNDLDRVVWNHVEQAHAPQEVEVYEAEPMPYDPR